jgi:thioredoxin-dependent peroxiredoxin
MKKALLTSLAAAIVASSAYAAIGVGADAPKFTAQASLNGKEFTYSLEESLKQGPTVVYFYPSAYTQGCNIQAHTFAINMDKFKEAGASVVGVSLDSIERLNDFSADPDYCAGQLPVASDSDGKIADSYELMVSAAPAADAGFKDTRGNAIDHGFAERTTFIVGTDGKIVGTVASTRGGISPEENGLKALEIVEAL